MKNLSYVMMIIVITITKIDCSLRKNLQARPLPPPPYSAIIQSKEYDDGTMKKLFRNGDEIIYLNSRSASVITSMFDDEKTQQIKEQHSRIKQSCKASTNIKR